MKIRHYLAATITLLLSLGAAQSASLTYTSKAAFLADLQPGYYLNDFTGLPSAYYNNFSAAYGRNHHAASIILAEVVRLDEVLVVILITHRGYSLVV